MGLTERGCRGKWGRTSWTTGVPSRPISCTTVPVGNARWLLWTSTLTAEGKVGFVMTAPSSWTSTT